MTSDRSAWFRRHRIATTGMLLSVATGIGLAVLGLIGQGLTPSEWTIGIIMTIQPTALCLSIDVLTQLARVNEDLREGGSLMAAALNSTTLRTHLLGIAKCSSDETLSKIAPPFLRDAVEKRYKQFHSAMQQVALDKKIVFGTGESRTIDRQLAGVATETILASANVFQAVVDFWKSEQGDNYWDEHVTRLQECPSLRCTRIFILGERDPSKWADIIDELEDRSASDR